MPPLTEADWSDETREPRRRRRYRTYGIGLLGIVVLSLLVLYLRWDPFGQSGPTPPKAKAPEVEYAKGTSRTLEQMDGAYRSHVPPAMPAPTGTPPGEPSKLEETLNQVQQTQQSMQALLQTQALALQEVLKRLHESATHATTPTTTPTETAEQRAQRAKAAAQAEEERQKKLKSWKPKGGAWESESKADHAKEAAKWTSVRPYSTLPGADFNCIVEDTITNQAPGLAVAILREPVWDSTGQHLLAPQGGRFVLRTSSGQVYGTQRQTVQVLSFTIPPSPTDPEGAPAQTIKLTGASAGNAAGQAGFQDQVDHRYGAQLATVLIKGVLNAGTGIAAYGTGGQDVAQRVGGSVANQAAQQGQEQVRQVIDTSPIFTIRRGYLCTIRLEDALEFPGPYAS